LCQLFIPVVVFDMALAMMAILSDGAGAADGADQQE
jgi:hypothetical protein